MFQQKPFYHVHPGVRVVFDFDARGSGDLSVCLPMLAGRAHFAGLVQKRLALSTQASHHRVELEVADVLPDNPPTTARLGFAVFNGGSAEVSNLHVSFTSDK